MTDLQSICEMFDVQVLRDYWGGTDECPEAGYPMFALGCKPELAAGLRGYQMTPWFDSMDNLNSFCTRNMAKFEEFFNSDPDAPAPDATGWL